MAIETHLDVVYLLHRNFISHRTCPVITLSDQVYELCIDALKSNHDRLLTNDTTSFRADRPE